MLIIIYFLCVRPQMSMPGDIFFNSQTSYFAGNLTAFVKNGTISEARVDDMAERIIAGWYLLGQDNNYPNGASHLSSSPLSDSDLCLQ